MPAPTIDHGVHAVRTLPCRSVLALLSPPPRRSCSAHSAQGRPLPRGTRVGDAPAKVLVVGSIHGNETAGRAVIARAARRDAAGRRAAVARRLASTPTASRRGTRQNARGVDLNRNFARRWRGGGRPFDTYFPGRRAFSEPETRAVRRLVQPPPAGRDGLVPPAPAAGRPVAGRRPARSSAATRAASACRRAPLPNYRGTATSWQNHTFPGTSAFVVELPGRPAQRRRRAPPRAGGAWRRGAARPRASQARARAIVWRRSRSAPSASARRAPTPAATTAPPRTRLSPEGDRRALHGVVDASRRAFNTFASNAPDVELHERPGVCAHFIVDTDGTIHQLVSLKLMLPPHGRAQRPRDRDRARRHRPTAQIMGRPAPAPRLPAADALAAVRATAIRDPRRDRPRREPVEPLPPRARRAPAHRRRTATCRPRPCAATGRSCDRDRPRPPRRDRVEPLRAAHRRAPTSRSPRRARRRRARSRRSSPAASSRSSSPRRCSARARDRRAGRLRRRAELDEDLRRAGLRRLRGPHDQGHPRRAPGLGRLARRLPGRRAARAARRPRRPRDRACAGGRRRRRSSFAHAHLLRDPRRTLDRARARRRRQLVLGTAAVRRSASSASGACCAPGTCPNSCTVGALCRAHGPDLVCGHHAHAQAGPSTSAGGRGPGPRSAR